LKLYCVQLWFAALDGWNKEKISNAKAINAYRIQAGYKSCVSFAERLALQLSAKDTL